MDDVTTSEPLASSQDTRLDAGAFFDLKIAGASMTDCQYATKLAYSTIHEIARHKRRANPDTAQLLEDWSRKVGGGVHISAAKLLGLKLSVEATSP